MIKSTNLFFFLVSFFTINCFAQLPGTIDSTFGNNGIVRTFINSKNDNLNALAIQSDDKILAAGYAVYDTMNYKNAFALVRYHANGTIDSSFAMNGKLIYNFNNESAIAYAIKLQSDGKIILAGTVVSSNTNKFAAIRIHSDGSLDSTFGNNGELISSMGTIDDRALCIYLHNDGRFILGGYSKLSSYQRLAMARYMSDGSIDTTFGIAGKVIAGISGDNIYCQAIETDSSSNYLVSGSYTAITSTYAFLKRYTSNGALDMSFGINGTWSPGVGNGFSEYTTGIIKQADGKLLVGLSADYTATKKFGVIKYLPSSWTQDTSFGIYNGHSYLNTGINRYVATSLLQQANGKVVITGIYNSGSVFKYATLRYTASGLVDSAFGNNGIVITSILPSNENSKTVSCALQSNGGIIVAGNNTQNNVKRFTLVRLRGDNNITVNLKANVLKNTIHVYPNPANSILYVNCELNKTQCKVFDLLVMKFKWNIQKVIWKIIVIKMLNLIFNI